MSYLPAVKFIYKVEKWWKNVSKRTISPNVQQKRQTSTVLSFRPRRYQQRIRSFARSITAPVSSVSFYWFVNTSYLMIALWRIGMENSKVFFRLSDARTEMMRFSFLTHVNNSSVFSYVAPFQSRTSRCSTTSRATKFKGSKRMKCLKDKLTAAHLKAWLYKWDFRRDLHKYTDPASLISSGRSFQSRGAPTAVVL